MCSAGFSISTLYLLMFINEIQMEKKKRRVGVFLANSSKFTIYQKG